VISKVCNALGTLILLLIILAAGGILVLTLLGYKPMAILSGSMEPAYNVGGLVFIDTNAAPDDVAVGDVITFTIGEDTVVTHRVLAMGGGEFTTKGDANDSNDLAPVPYGAMIGRAWLHIPQAGYALMNLKTAKGFAAGALLLAVLIVLFVVPALLAPPKKGEETQKKGGTDHENNEE
ncbi:MAG: signal peptidase I, partial [Oscillospiraceae bacterium]|nr:signal peptidase I [Oscillospiraceae bacterium]